MATIRRTDLIASIALGCTLSFATQTFGQTIINSVPVERIENVQTVTVTVQAAPRQHLGTGPVDMNNLPQDILNCDVCRQRLGLPPLNTVANSSSNPVTTTVKQSISKPSPTSQASTPPGTSSVAPQTGRMLGSPGMISSATAEQLALNGMVVEEFKPPQPEQNAIQLGALPPEVRQEFMRGLGLPPGARIMSAEIKGLTSKKDGETVKAEAVANVEAISAQPKSLKPEASSTPSPKGGTLGGAGIVSTPEPTAAAAITEAVTSEDLKAATTTFETIAPPVPVVASPTVSPAVDVSAERNELRQTIEKLQKQLTEQASKFASEKARIEAEAALKSQAIDAMKKQFEENASKISDQMERFQLEGKKRLEQSESASKEALAMLEKRTAEITELQLQLKAQQEGYAKTQKELSVASEALAKESSATEKRSASDKPDGKKKPQNKGKKPAKPTEIQ